MARISKKKQEISEARKQANKDWNDKNLMKRYDHIHLVVPAGTKARIDAAAEAANESLNGYITKATEQRMESGK